MSKEKDLIRGQENHAAKARTAKQQAEAALAALLGGDPPASYDAGDGPAGKQPT